MEGNDIQCDLGGADSDWSVYQWRDESIADLFAPWYIASVSTYLCLCTTRTLGCFRTASIIYNRSRNAESNGVCWPPVSSAPHRVDPVVIKRSVLLHLHIVARRVTTYIPIHSSSVRSDHDAAVQRCYQTGDVTRRPVYRCRRNDSVHSATIITERQVISATEESTIIHLECT